MVSEQSILYYVGYRSDVPNSAEGIEIMIQDLTP